MEKESAERKIRFVSCKRWNERDDVYYQIKDENFTKEELFNKIWEQESFGDNATVTVHIKKIREKIEAARMDGNSVGGTVEIAVVGLPAGCGDTMFGSIESRISEALFGVPAVKGIEFGAGFGFDKMLGSEANDRYVNKDGKIATVSNNNGGILGGLSNGMPVIFRAVLKPTPSISKPQETLNLTTMEAETLSIKGRHDPCVVVRGLAAIENLVCFVICDILKGNGII